VDLKRGPETYEAGVLHLSVSASCIQETNARPRAALMRCSPLHPRPIFHFFVNRKEPPMSSATPMAAKNRRRTRNSVPELVQIRRSGTYASQVKKATNGNHTWF